MLSEAYSWNNIKESAVMFYEQPKDMLGYFRQEMRNNGIPVLFASAIESFLSGTVDIDGKDITAIFGEYEYIPDYMKDEWLKTGRRQSNYKPSMDKNWLNLSRQFADPCMPSRKGENIFTSKEIVNRDINRGEDIFSAAISGKTQERGRNIFE